MGEAIGLRSLKRLVISTLIGLAPIFPVWGESPENIDYDAFMYKNEATKIPSTDFSTDDKIIVQIIFKNLPKGDYIFHADWHNAMGDLQETSRYRFMIQKKTDEIIEAQLKITKASPLRRLFSASEATGYHLKFYGKWQVKLYLNGEEIIRKHFSVR